MRYEVEQRDTSSTLKTLHDISGDYLRILNARKPTIAQVSTEGLTAVGYGMVIVKEPFNADLDTIGVGALFTCHRQLNAWGHSALRPRE